MMIKYHKLLKNANCKQKNCKSEFLNHQESISHRNIKTWRLFDLMYDQTRMKHPNREICDCPTNSRKVDGRFTRSIKFASFFGLSISSFFRRFGSIFKPLRHKTKQISNCHHHHLLALLCFQISGPHF